jgi:hypothetical protein
VRKSDLKIGHVKVKLECVRTYVSAFDRTRAECICGKCALRSNLRGLHERVCVMGCCGRTHEGEFVRSPVYTFERT